MSYWVTAIYLQIYSVKLVAVIGIVALVAAWTAIRGIFRRPPEGPPLEAEEVHAQDAPRLWTRLRELATRLRTAPPAHVVAGIDDNFFVTENGVTLANGKLSGRTLYVSLPLLRTLSSSEADAVLAHELAHFQGGDAAASGQLGPHLVRFGNYLIELGSNGATKPAYYLLRMFGTIFELALAKEQRRRELMADTTASRITSPDDIGRALVKTTAYSSFRATTEQTLFAQDAAHMASLGLRDRIDGGLGAHAASPHFAETLKSLRTPHPFDSHPVLEERFRNINTRVRVDQAAEVMSAARAGSWTDDIGTAGAIEQRLWEAYEARFREHHEQSLAYRYRPANDAERALVDRYFPAHTFEAKDHEVRITHEGLVLPAFDLPVLPFALIVKAEIKQTSFAHELKLEYGPPGATKRTKVNLRKLGKQAEALKLLFNQYWARDQAARQYEQLRRNAADING